MNNILLDEDINYALGDHISYELLCEHKIVPIKDSELCIIVAISSKQIDCDMSAFINIFQKPIKFVYIKEKYINIELQEYRFKKKLFVHAIKALDDTHTENENSHIINFIDTLFVFSIDKNASDIHFEALNDSVIIRVRIDGELNQIFRFNIALFPLMSSIIKYFGNLDISQRRIPLNGRFTREVLTSKYDFRISTMPTVYGESIVLRILDNGNIQKDINTIGFDADTLEIIQKNIHLPQGLILVTGPTGSGKTTSLYSMIKNLNTKNKKIITIEDPVEYKLDGVMQVNINNEINLNYGIVLKNILRQDPDILLIGEIRDVESLQIAIQASLTGHLVIATLHTNNALETITRLLDLNAQSYLVATTLKMVLSQRLVRLLCPKCKIKVPNKNIFSSSGCEFCNYTGYKNRQVVSEVLTVDTTLSEMISQNKNLYEIEKYANKIGYKRLEENGMDLVNGGLTTLEELYTKVSSKV